MGILCFENDSLQKKRSSPTKMRRSKQTKDCVAANSMMASIAFVLYYGKSNHFCTKSKLDLSTLLQVCQTIRCKQFVVR